MIHLGDCVTVMAAMPADSVDAVVTDPPYGLEFMGRDWDRLGNVGKTSHAGVEASSGSRDRSYNAAFGRLGKVAHNGSANRKCRRCNKWAWDHEGRKCVCEVPDFPNVAGHQARLMQEWHYNWAVEALRVTKPGGYLLAFGGTRTHHRLVCGLEDAGWIIRDELDWIYASGFPKGRANLKPAHEPIVLARKPGPLRPLNIEETRIGTDGGTRAVDFGTKPNGQTRRWEPGYEGARNNIEAIAAGRWPSNLLLSDPQLFDEPNPWVVGSGAFTESSKGELTFRRSGDSPVWIDGMMKPGRETTVMGHGDSGGYSRFFIIPKSSRADREPVLRGQLPERVIEVSVIQTKGVGESGKTINGKQASSPRENSHATVKPTDLMRHLIRLVTPPGGTVLDPFLGSGSTAIAAELEGFPWIGIEKEPEYVAIAEARLNGTQRGLGLDVPAPTTVRVPGSSKPIERKAGTPNITGATYSGGRIRQKEYTSPGYDDGPRRPPKPEKPTADTAPLFEDDAA